jgi:hypothetical protein
METDFITEAIAKEQFDSIEGALEKSVHTTLRAMSGWDINLYPYGEGTFDAHVGYLGDVVFIFTNIPISKVAKLFYRITSFNRTTQNPLQQLQDTL